MVYLKRQKKERKHSNVLLPLLVNQALMIASGVNKYDESCCDDLILDSIILPYYYSVS